MQRPDGQSGSTLIEVAVAMATVAILSFSVLLGFSTATTQDRQAYEVTRVQNSATAMLEIIESIPHDDLKAIAGIQFSIYLDSHVITAQVTEVSDDLLALEATAMVASDGSYPVRLVTLKTRKEELNNI